MIVEDEKRGVDARPKSWPGSPTRFSESVKWLFLLFPAIVVIAASLLIVVPMIVRLWVVGK